MPTIITVNGYRFYFYSEDHRPIHVHVDYSGASAKVNIEGTVSIVKAKGFSKKGLTKLVKFCKEQQDFIIQQWEDYFDDET